MPTGLIRRNGRYSLRRVIPLDLQAHYARREIVQALGTADRAEAKKRHAKEWRLLDLEFEEVRRHLGSASDAQAAVPTSVAPHKYADTSGRDANLEAEHAAYLEALEEDDAAERGEAAEQALIARLRVPMDSLSEEDQAIARVLRHNAWKAQVAHEHAAIARSQARAPEAKPSKANQSKTRLSAVMDRWAAEMQPKARHVTRTRNIVARFEAVNGAVAVEDVTKHHVLAFKDALIVQGQTAANINVMIPMNRPGFAGGLNS